MSAQLMNVLKRHARREFAVSVRAGIIADATNKAKEFYFSRPGGLDAYECIYHLADQGVTLRVAEVAERRAFREMIVLCGELH